MCMVISGSGAASIVYTDDDYSFTAPATNTSWTFSGVNIGTASATRLVIVGVFYVNATPNTATCTIAGVAGTSAVHTRSTGGTADETEAMIFTASVASGTTATITVNTGTAKGCWIGVWSAYDLTSTTPVDTSVAPSSGTTITLDLDVSPGGVACGMGITPAASTWTGFTEDYDKISGVWTSGASVASSSGATPLTVRATTTSAGATMCAASFR
ncbi:MAG: hypothetical protein IPL32_18645 [Chloracidobacterium sp.]|nr:hypothetical protein [Chloracidobacterium sp.]